ncbi:MAG: hypothetical protein PHT34_00145 [Oscillospiraceae bacterium]|nr:hypothetical protein [Oscillospiraceae bacterium]
MGLIVNNDRFNGDVNRLGELLITWDEDQKAQEETSALKKQDTHKTGEGKTSQK